jgi:hypothetical protein
MMSLKKSYQAKHLPNQEDLALRYQEVQWLRRLVSQFESSRQATPLPAFNSLFKVSIVATGTMARFLPTDELRPRLKRGSRMRTLN